MNETAQMTEKEYQEIITKDITWLKQFPQCSERDHIEAILKASRLEKPEPKIADFMAFFRRIEKDLIDKVGFVEWQNEKVYFPTEIHEIVAKWIDSNFTA